MNPFVSFASTVALLPLDDIDTDQIIPARYLKGTDTAFVVVGAAHVIGEKGIAHALESKKYKIEKLTLNLFQLRVDRSLQRRIRRCGHSRRLNFRNA